MHIDNHKIRGPTCRSDCADVRQFNFISFLPKTCKRHPIFVFMETNGKKNCSCFVIPIKWVSGLGEPAFLAWEFLVLEHAVADPYIIIKIYLLK